ncbi:hypothetical protein Tco_0430855 [Tanacetum coccineum]
MEYVKKSIDKRALHKREYDSRVNDRQMQITEEKVDTSKALDDSLVDTESSGTISKEQDTNSRSRNDAHADDADIRPIYDEEPMAEVQTTAEINVFAIGQQLTEQPEFNNEGEIVQLILFIVDSGCTKHMAGNLKLLCNFVEKYLGTVRFGNDQFAPILGYGDLVQGNIMINRVYYVEGLNHNLFSVGQFYDANLEVAFQKSTCFARDLQGNNLLTGNRGSDLYTISLQEMTSSTPICLMAKASPTQAWLWHL